MEGAGMEEGMEEGMDGGMEEAMDGADMDGAGMDGAYEEGSPEIQQQDGGSPAMMAEQHEQHEHEGRGRLDGAEESAVIGGGEQEDQEQPALQYEMDNGIGGFADVGQAELNKTELMENYR